MHRKAMRTRLMSFLPACSLHVLIASSMAICRKNADSAQQCAPDGGLSLVAWYFGLSTFFADRSPRHNVKLARACMWRGWSPTVPWRCSHVHKILLESLLTDKSLGSVLSKHGAVSKRVAERNGAISYHICRSGATVAERAARIEAWYRDRCRSCHSNRSCCALRLFGHPMSKASGVEAAHCERRRSNGAQLSVKAMRQRISTINANSGGIGGTKDLRVGCPSNTRTCWLYSNFPKERE